MSLINTPPVPQYSLGILAAKDFDSRDLLDDLLAAKVETIQHLYTNGANALVTDFAMRSGIPFTVYPVSGGKGLPWSTREVVEASEVVLIIATPESKSAAQIVKACREREARLKAGAQRQLDAGEAVTTFKWREIPYEPISHWREKVCQVEEALAALTEEDVAASDFARAVAGIVGGKA
jgi:hypothetical protein